MYILNSNQVIVKEYHHQCSDVEVATIDIDEKEYNAVRTYHDASRLPDCTSNVLTSKWRIVTSNEGYCNPCGVIFPITN